MKFTDRDDLRSSSLEGRAGERKVARSSRPVQTIAIAGGKGGDGKSSIAINLSMALAQKSHKVLLMDGNLGLGNINVLLGMDMQYDISDVLRGYKSLPDIIVEGPCGVKIVPGAIGDVEMTQLSQIEHMGIVNAFSELPFDADILVIDTESGISQSVMSFTRASREILIVVSDEPASIHDAFATIQALSCEPHCRRFRIVANKAESSQHGLELYKRLARLAEKHLDVVIDFCGSIPLDSQLHCSVCERRAVVEAYPRSKSSISFAKLASKVERWPWPLEPKGHLEFFVERLVQTSLDAR